MDGAKSRGGKKSLLGRLSVSGTAFSVGLRLHLISKTLRMFSVGGHRFYQYLPNLPKIKFSTIELLLLKNQY
jgi:hypothetical protein